MKIYTKRGDSGYTDIIGNRVTKADPIIKSIGSLDSLNAQIGMLLSYNIDDNPLLHRIMHQIFIISAVIQCPNKYFIDTDLVQNIELVIDNLSEKIPKLTNFIFPYVRSKNNDTESQKICQYVSEIHRTRCVCREAERNFVEISTTINNQTQEILELLNRMSDYFFIYARYITYTYNLEETIFVNK